MNPTVSLLQPLFKRGCSPAISAGRILIVLSVLQGFGCTSAPYRPCSQAGDLTGLPRVKGEFSVKPPKHKECYLVNHGPFKQLHPDGFTTALEGQFNDGVRNGKWLQYSPTGKLMAEFHYDERGVLKVGNAPLSTEPALRVDPEATARPKVRE